MLYIFNIVAGVTYFFVGRLKNVFLYDRKKQLCFKFPCNAIVLSMLFSNTKVMKSLLLTFVVAATCAKPFVTFHVFLRRTELSWFFCVNIFVLYYSETNFHFSPTMACVKLKWRVGMAFLLREEMEEILLITKSTQAWERINLNLLPSASVKIILNALVTVLIKSDTYYKTFVFPHHIASCSEWWVVLIEWALGNSDQIPAFSSRIIFCVECRYLQFTAVMRRNFKKLVKNWYN